MCYIFFFIRAYLFLLIQSTYNWQLASITYGHYSQLVLYAPYVYNNMFVNTLADCRVIELNYMQGKSY